MFNHPIPNQTGTSCAVILQASENVYFEGQARDLIFNNLVSLVSIQAISMLLQDCQIRSVPEFEGIYQKKCSSLQLEYLERRCSREE